MRSVLLCFMPLTCLPLGCSKPPAQHPIQVAPPAVAQNDVEAEPEPELSERDLTLHLMTKAELHRAGRILSELEKNGMWSLRELDLIFVANHEPVFRQSLLENAKRIPERESACAEFNKLSLSADQTLEFLLKAKGGMRNACTEAMLAMREGKPVEDQSVQRRLYELSFMRMAMIRYWAKENRKIEIPFPE